LEPYGKLALGFDKADMWPRYYFYLNLAMIEVEAWLRKRGQWDDEKSKWSDVKNPLQEG
jgi:hypothetical protein